MCISVDMCDHIISKSKFKLNKGDATPKKKYNYGMVLFYNFHQNRNIFLSLKEYIIS